MTKKSESPVVLSTHSIATGENYDDAVILTDHEVKFQTCSKLTQAQRFHFVKVVSVLIKLCQILLFRATEISGMSQFINFNFVFTNNNFGEVCIVCRSHS